MGLINNVSWKNTKSDFIDYLFESSKNAPSTGNNAYVADLALIKELVEKYGLSKSQISNILETYKPNSIFESDWQTTVSQIADDLREMDSWDDIVGEEPVAPNPDDYFAQATANIDAEDAELNKLYDSILNRQTESLNQELDENRAAFKDFRNQALTNNAMNQNQIAGATRFELQRQQRNAISRGASAAQRLVANINTQLGMQAKSAQQSLETSNMLAQQLLAQRTANANLRNQYNSNLDADAMRRSDLLKGRSERINNYQNMLYGQARDAYLDKRDVYNENVSKIQGTNPWSSAYTSYLAKKSNNTL